MKSTTVVLLLIVFVPICAQCEEVFSCGQAQTSVIPFLTNAQLATHRWPWHVAIYHQACENASVYQCGGSLISANAILTAAHCVLVPEAQVTVSLGRLLLNESTSGASFHKVAKIIRHPDFLEEYKRNDIAIIELANTVTFDNYVQPVCLWSADKIHFSNIVGKFGTVVGWGHTESGQVSNALREAYMPVVDAFTCLESNPDLFGGFLSRGNFCAGTRNGTSICTGDSGGSMTFEQNGRFFIRGIVSVGPSKLIYETKEIVCDPMQYVVFTDVLPYLPWIQSFVTFRIVECEERVRCESRWGQCFIFLHGSSNTTGCRIVFDEILNGTVTHLTATGQSDVIPDLSDVAEKFQALDSLQFSNISLKAVHRDRLSPFKGIKRLDLQRNRISRFDAADTFGDLKNLERLDLSNNQLDELPEDIFRNNGQLRELQLDSNQIREIHVGELRNLESLWLPSNKLETLPADVFHNNTKMRELKLDDNQLGELHADVFAQLVDLENLHLDKNVLLNLPADIFRNNGKLRALSIGHNQLRELHVDQFKDLVDLEEIHLQLNRLEVIPAGLFRNNRKLKKIYLSDNRLKDLHVDFFAQLINLEICESHGNRFEVIPADLFRNNGQLRELDLSSNQIREIHVGELRNRENLFYYLPVNAFLNNAKLEMLNVGDNQLGDLHVDTFVQLVQLRALFLHRNRLAELPVDIFRNNRKLLTLNLGRNQLTKLHVDQFENLVDLEQIQLYNNQLEVIPAGLFRNNLKLQEIDLEANKIKQMDFDLATHSAIRKLDFSDNVCMDEKCGSWSFCDAQTLSEIFDKIQKNCREN
ncbi:hypothetical protein HA402_004339 [Bradysia odoriphaga]|nr:hypothetical protein HA402_004339 [Bradysia odoriphaga]